MAKIPQWLGTGNLNLSAPTEWDAAARLGIALGLGVAVAGLYRITVGRQKADAGAMTTTLALLGVLVAMVTLIIGNELARAFTLGGTLAIVRFRTVVADTRDTAFVIFAVVTGMAVGYDQAWVAYLGFPVVAGVVLAAEVFARRGSQSVDRRVVIRLPFDADPTATTAAAFATHTHRSALSSIESAKQGTFMEVTYKVRLCSANSAIALVMQLRKLEAVQSVEVKD